jgi:hypothetical protein
MRKHLKRILLLIFAVWHTGLVSASHYTLPESCNEIVGLTYHDRLHATFGFDRDMPTDSLKRAEIKRLKADTVYHHIRRDAVLWSAFIPGAGQLYNEIGYRKIPQRKNMAWWKVPIIYGGLGTIGYFFYQNLATARALKAEWIYRDKGYGAFLYPEYETWTSDELLNNKTIEVPVTDTTYYNKTLPGFDLAAKRRDMLGFGFIALWGLQVVEALVDAHFVTFDVSEDLSFHWSPAMLDLNTPGVALRLEIH